MAAVKKSAAKVPAKKAPAKVPGTLKRITLDGAKVTAVQVLGKSVAIAPKPAPVKADPPAPKTPRTWVVDQPGQMRRRIVALDADAAVRAFVALVHTGGNLAEIGTGIANPNRSVDYVVKVNGGTFRITVEDAK